MTMAEMFLLGWAGVMTALWQLKVREHKVFMRATATVIEDVVEGKRLRLKVYGAIPPEAGETVADPLPIVAVTPVGSVIVTGRPAIGTPAASLTVAVTATAPSDAVPDVETAPSVAALAAVSAVVAEGEVVIVVAVRADTQVIVATF